MTEKMDIPIDCHETNIPWLWLFVSEQKQIAMMADEKSPTRISHRLFATSCSEMRIFMENYLKLVRQAKCGDVDAFARLYAGIYEDMYRFALYTLRNASDAEDAVSDAVTDAFALIRKLRSEDAFKSWIFRLLSNKCKDKLREYAGRNETGIEDMEEIAFDSGPEMTECIQVRKLFFELADEERLIISMHQFAGYTSREISEILHMNENTVRSKESRALRKMKQQLQ